MDIFTIKKLSNLAKIELSSEDINDLLKENDLFSLIEQLKAINTEKVDPMGHPLGITQRTRKDIPCKRDIKNDNIEENLFIVPGVFE